MVPCRIGVRLAIVALALGPGIATAQGFSSEADKALLQRSQQQEEFSLRTRQYEQAINPALTPSQRQNLEGRQVQQQIDQRQLHDSQVRRQSELLQRLPQLPEAQQRSAVDAQNAEFARERGGE